MAEQEYIEKEFSDGSPRLELMGLLNNLRAYYWKRDWDSSFLLRIARFSLYTYYKAKLTIAQAGYTSKTIAIYFRKQGAKIGEHCDIQVNSLSTEPYLVSIGNHVFISPGVTFHTHDGGVWIFRDKIPGVRVYGTITVEDNCLIGRNAQLLPNVHIGRNSIVGAGSVVISDIAPNSIVMGVPARTIGSVPKYEENCLAKWKEQNLPDLPFEANYGWWLYKENKEKLRKHLTDLFMNQGKKEGKEDEK